MAEHVIESIIPGKSLFMQAGARQLLVVTGGDDQALHMMRLSVAGASPAGLILERTADVHLDNAHFSAVKVTAHTCRSWPAQLLN
jgi:hypothetical protein